nr:immunoglobulin light chain junction region [Mus musculus]
CQQYWSTPRTF